MAKVASKSVRVVQPWLLDQKCFHKHLTLGVSQARDLPARKMLMFFSFSTRKSELLHSSVTLKLSG